MTTIATDVGRPTLKAAVASVDEFVLPESSHLATEGSGAPPWTRRYVAALTSCDLTAALLATLICWIVQPASEVQGVVVLSWRVDYWVLAVLITPIWLAALALSGAYRHRTAGQGLADYRVAARTAVRLAAAACILAFVLHASLSRLLVVVYFPVLLILAVGLRCGCRQGLSMLRRRGLALRRLLLVGDAGCVEKFVDHLQRSPMTEYQLVGICAPEGSRPSPDKVATEVVGRPDDAVAKARALRADTVVLVGHPRLENTTLQEISWRIEGSGRNLLVAPDLVDVAGPRIRTASICGLPMLQIGEPLIGVRRQIVKASYERPFALLLTLLLSPLLAFIALAILIDSAGQALYRQERVGYKGRRFTMLKFRTMVPGADARLAELLERNEHDGALFKMRADPRVTRVGQWLRRYSLDELPQLLNVVKGDMALIGPRPCLASEEATFDEAAKRRFLARPGVTGLWQVSGRSDLPWAEAVRLDMYYVENWTPWMDLMILWRTLRVVLSGHGGY